jgi:hypothetical protein
VLFDICPPELGVLMFLVTAVAFPYEIIEVVITNLVSFTVVEFNLFFAAITGRYVFHMSSKVEHVIG